MKKELYRMVSASAGLLCLSGAMAQTQKPNVIYIMADDLGYGDLECYNGKQATPNTNLLASQGCMFLNAHSVASTSTPSRFSLLTGKYSWRQNGTGIADGDAKMIISPDTYTVADMFHAAGYATAAYGKWHLGLGSVSGGQDWNGELDQDLNDLGFDDWQIMAATADRVPCVFIAGHSDRGGRSAQHGRVVNLTATDPIRVNYASAIGDSCGYDYPAACKLLPSDNRGHGNTIVDSIPRIGHMTGGYSARWKDENMADTIVAKATGFMARSVKAGEPFFIYMATNDVHVPRYPHKRFRGKSAMGLRGEAIMSFDWSVGKVMKALDSLGVTNNTILVVTSDNGPVLDDGYADNCVALTTAVSHKISGGLKGGKYGLYEGGTTVPFFVRWPGHVGAGSKSGALVSQIDFMATMADYLGVKIPLGEAPDSKAQPAGWFAIDLTGGRDHITETNNAGQLCIRTKDWKYISDSELYSMNKTEQQGTYTTLNTATEATNEFSSQPAALATMRALAAEEVAKEGEYDLLKQARQYVKAIEEKDTTSTAYTLPKGYQDTLLVTYKAAVQSGNSDSLLAVIQVINKYLSLRNGLANNTFVTNEALSEKDLGILSIEQLQSIKDRVANAGNMAVDVPLFADIDKFYVPDTLALYALYNRGTSKYAGMSNATTSQHSATLPAEDNSYAWHFVYAPDAKAYYLYNAKLSQPLSRPNSTASIFTKTPAEADTWKVVPTTNGLFKVTINSSKVTSARSYLFDDGSGIGAYSDAGNSGTSWKILKTGSVTGIPTVSTHMAATERIFNLHGQQVEITDKGIFIVNGKKIAFN